MGGCGLVEDVSDLLGAAVGDFDTDMRLICREGLMESFLLTLREPITRGAQEKPDLVEGIACASTVSGRVLLDAAAHLTWGITGECDDVTGAWHAGGVLGAGQAMAFLLPLGRGSSVAIRTPARKSFPRSASQFLYTVPDLPGTRSTQPCRGMILPASQVHDAGDLVGPGGVGLGGATRAHQPPAPEPLRSGRGSDAAVQTRLDMGPHGIPCGSSLAGQASDGGSFEAQLSDRPADRPHTQTRPGCAHRVVLLNESHDPAGAFAAHPAPYCATRSAQGTPAQGASITSTTTRP